MPGRLRLGREALHDVAQFLSFHLVQLPKVTAMAGTSGRYPNP